MAIIGRALPWMIATSLIAASPALAQGPLVTPQPAPNSSVAPYFVNPASEPTVSRDEMLRLLRQKVKYVFVIFNENHSFDNEFGTFPGANGIYADPNGPRDAAHTPGFTQTYKDKAGKSYTVTPFRIGPEENASYTDSVDHSHVGLAHKLHVVDGKPTMDGFAQADFDRFLGPGSPAAEAMGHQFARLVMSHIDCDTIPFFWQWANRFTLFDNIFATEDTPSTPNAIAMIAGQSGETQWVKHGNAPQPVSVSSFSTKGAHSGNLQTPPLVNDPQPFWGSQYDPTTSGLRQPGQAPWENSGDSNVATNLTFASLPLTLSGGQTGGPDEAGRRIGNRPRRHQPGHPLHHRPQRCAGVLALVPGGLRPRAV